MRKVAVQLPVLEHLPAAHRTRVPDCADRAAVAEARLQPDALDARDRVACAGGFD